MSTEWLFLLPLGFYDNIQSLSANKPDYTLSYESLLSNPCLYLILCTIYYQKPNIL